MQKYTGVVQKRSGAAVADATVTVLQESVATTIYSSDSLSATTTNPLTTNADGEYSFYAPNGRYSIQIEAAGLVTETVEDVLLFDPVALPVSVLDYGAVGDGSTDDTAEIQAALDTGRDVFVPGTSTYYKISAALTMRDTQKIYGDGTRSQIRQTGALANVITVSGKTGAAVEDLLLYAIGTRSVYADGAGVLLSGCTRCRVSGVTVQNHRGGGVVVYNSNDCQVEGNDFISSPVLDTDPDDTHAFADIAVVYSSSRNIVRGNHCISGQGTGILVQAVGGSDACDENIVANNIVRNTKVYGIVAYRNSSAYPTTMSVRGTVISGNTVYNVGGSLVNSITGTYTFGAGIYLQGAEEAVVSGNRITGTHSYARSFTELLAPGAIGAVNMSRYTITGNVIDDAGMFGIYVAEPNTWGEPVGGAIVSGNAITNCASSGINVKQLGNLSITGNTVDTTGLSGIRVNNTSIYPKISVCGNIVLNVTGLSGIEVNYADGIVVSGNHVHTTSTHGITTANSSDVHVNDNLVVDHTVRGIQILSTTTGASVFGNTIVGLGSSTEGIRFDAMTRFDKSNRISGCTSSWAGAYAVLRGTQSGTAVGNVGVGEDDLASYVLPASSMVVSGDTLKVLAWGTTANNANAKTLKMYFGGTLILTTSLTTGMAGVWRVEAEMVRTGVSTQRCVAHLTQAGTTTLIDTEATNVTETETAAITVKLTAEATGNNDIQQVGMVCEFRSA